MKTARVVVNDVSIGAWDDPVLVYNKFFQRGRTIDDLTTFDFECDFLILSIGEQDNEAVYHDYGQYYINKIGRFFFISNYHHLHEKLDIFARMDNFSNQDLSFIESSIIDFFDNTLTYED